MTMAIWKVSVMNFMNFAKKDFGDACLEIWTTCECQLDLFRSLETRFKTQKENERQEKLLLSVKKNITHQIYYRYDYLIIIIIFVATILVTTIIIKKNFRYCHPSLPNRWSGTSPWRRRKPTVQSLPIPSFSKKSQRDKSICLVWISDLNKHWN